MADAILLPVLAMVVAAAVWMARRRSAKGSACCGEHDAPLRRMGAADRNKSHYPHEVTLSIGGMTCDNCAARVENALNELPGTWARVSIASKTALVRTKDMPDLDALSRAVAAAGYAVLA
ncbi:MAG: heavy-metal-associated domain-containing protein [Atopobiaceae bacterium]|nr:heavy-metal-associated domain-containing protein [Atopobiaceae bacterium]